MKKKLVRYEKPTLENLEVVGRGQIGGNCVVGSSFWYLLNRCRSRRWLLF